MDDQPLPGRGAETLTITRTFRRVLTSAVLAGVFLVTAALPASAHTSLAGSTPANLSRLDSPPASLRLEFTDPVDPRTVTVRILDTDGTVYPGTRLATDSNEKATELEFTLPELPEGTYGAGWQSIGGDGHRASGEVVFGVGDVSQEQVDAARFQSLSAQDRIVDAAGAMGRFVWYLGLSLAVGALFILFWMAGAASTWTPGGRDLWSLSRLWLGRGIRLAIWGAGVRLAATITILSNSFQGGTTVSRVGRALSTSGIGFELVLLLFLAAAAVFAGPVSAQPYQGRSDARWRKIGISIALAVLAGSVGGHLAVNRAPEVAAFVSSAHILAAALWVGPLSVVALWLANARRTDVAAADRSAVLAAFFPRFARAAGWSLLVLVITGAEALWANIGTNLFGNSYGVALSIKLALLLVVILPLAWAHDQRVRSNPASMGDPKFGKTLRLELAGLAAVLVLASSLALLNPTAGSGRAGAAAPNDALSAQPVADVQECAGLAVGQPNCYKTYFSALMRSDDAGVAVARVLEVAESDEYVASQCHQITHDLGREAAGYYSSLGEALSFEASACWSGYYHGVVEQLMSEYDDQQLLDEVPTFCDEPAKNQYSFVHYNCVHGVGHGIMLRFDADLFQSLPYCERLTDPWELSSCASGAFMQNVVSAQEGHTEATFKEDDLVYPCNAVETQYKDECFGMQTSYILWRSNQDLAKGFEICDAVEADFADDCYQSMGRDISGNSLLDPQKVVAGCNLGGEALREYCIVGASLNAVYNDHNTVKATELCRLVDAVYEKACLDARDRAAASF